ncbi:MAG: hypothetical protein ACKVQK_26585 [Burkholderiales bacterium]
MTDPAIETNFCLKGMKIMSKFWCATAAVTLAITATLNAALAKPQTCPSISILADATRLAVMQSGQVDFAAEIRKPALACTLSGGTAKSQLSFWVKSAISPTGQVGERSVPYFVAIIVNGQVIGKEIFNLKLPFSAAERKVLVKESVARIDIPIEKGKTAEDYSVTIGFQLTEEQAAYNRAAK